MVIASPPLYGYHSTLKAVSSGERCDSNEMENFSDNFPNIRNLLINLDMGISFVVAYFPISSKAEAGKEMGLFGYLPSIQVDSFHSFWWDESWTEVFDYIISLNNVKEQFSCFRVQNTL